MTAADVQAALAPYTSDADAAFLGRFFKTGPGQYAEGDQFLGIKVPVTRRVCRDFRELSLAEIEKLLDSPFHEHRLAALIIMTEQAKSKRTSEARKKALFDLYLRRTDRINNWDLVDISCRDVVGSYLLNKPRDVLYKLARSDNLWERRIAMVTTWEFIRRGDLDDTFALAEVLLHDTHDLMHKAVGWMLREAGKKNEDRLRLFLDEHAAVMPRTMLRYSIEKFPPEVRLHYMSLGKSAYTRRATREVTMSNFSDLKAVFLNCTLKKSPEKSHTELLINASKQIMEKQGVQVEVIRPVDHDIATGVYPDMREHGWKTDDWVKISPKVMAADIVVIAGPIWLGDNSSVTKQIIERLYAHSGELNDKGQYIFYGKVGGALITGNEDGIKHCASNILYSLQHIGFTIPPNADAGWIGEAGPGPSYGDDVDDKKAGLDNDFTNRNVTFMTWNLLHVARLLKDNGGISAEGNSRKAWDAGTRFDFKNPEYR